MTPTQIFQGQHNTTTVVRVIYGRDAGDDSLGFDIVVSGRIVARVYRPEAVNDWFERNSKKLLAPWQGAFHRAGIGPDKLRPPAPLDVTLAVPYFSQRDNRKNPFGTCNVTSYAMCLAYLKIARRTQSGQFEDELSGFLETHGKDRHVHDDLAWMGRQYGAASRFGTERTWAQIRAQIRTGFPVIVSGLFTASGHIIVIRGVKGEDFIVNDPYGNALTRSATRRRYADNNGEALLYPFDYMNATVRAVGRDAKWAHFFSPKS